MMPATLKTCPRCQSTVPIDVQYCAVCGHSFLAVSGAAPVVDKPDSNRLLVFLLLWFFLGGLGVHRMYIGHTSTGVLQLVLMVVGIITSCFGVGIVLIVAVSVWVLVDLILVLTGSLKPADGGRLI